MSTSTPTVEAVRRAGAASVLDGWLHVQRAVRRAAGSPAPEVALEVLQAALGELGPVLDPRTEEGTHLAAQRAVLGDLRRVVTTGGGVWAGATPHVDHGDSHSHGEPGDVVCVLSIDHAEGEGADDATSLDALHDLAGRTRIAVRSYDLVSVQEGSLVVLLMKDVSVPVAWRRVNELVGERAAVCRGVPVGVRAGIAAVGADGPHTALRRARSALADSRLEASRWVSIASGGPGVGPHEAPAGP